MPANFDQQDVFRRKDPVTRGRWGLQRWDTDVEGGVSSGAGAKGTAERQAKLGRATTRPR